MLLEAAACKCTLWMQPSARPLLASLSPRLLKRSSLPSSRLLCLPLSGAASLPAVLERLLPTTPACHRTLSSESSVSTLRQLCSASRLLRSCLSAFGARQRRATHLPVRRHYDRVHCIDAAVISSTVEVTPVAAGAAVASRTTVFLKGCREMMGA